MRKSKIKVDGKNFKLNGYQAETENVIPTELADLSDGASVVGDIQSLQDSVSQVESDLTSKADVSYVDNKFNGAAKAIAYDNYSAMITAFNSLADDSYSVGQNVNIVTLNVPDLWVSSVEQTSVPYTYVDDATFTGELETNGYVQVGYYRLSALETQKVDLADYQKKLTAGQNITIDANNVISASGGNAVTLGTETQTFDGDKTFVMQNSTALKLQNYNNPYRYINFINNVVPSIILSRTTDRSLEIHGNDYILNRTPNGSTYMLFPDKHSGVNETFAMLSDIPTDFTAAEVNSESATSGQVLTADGNGGASWQNASGGSLYEHSIQIHIMIGTSTYDFYCSILNNKSTAYIQTSLENDIIDYGLFIPLSSRSQIQSYFDVSYIRYSSTSARIYAKTLSIDFTNESFTIEQSRISNIISVSDTVTQIM